jgi:hypothetical protein
MPDYPVIRNCAVLYSHWNLRCLLCLLVEAQDAAAQSEKTYMNKSLLLISFLLVAVLSPLRASALGPFGAICIDEALPGGGITVWGNPGNSSQNMGPGCGYDSFSVDIATSLTEQITFDVLMPFDNSVLAFSTLWEDTGRTVKSDVAVFTQNWSTDGTTFIMNVSFGSDPDFPSIPTGAFDLGGPTESGTFEGMLETNSGGIWVWFNARSELDSPPVPEPGSLFLLAGGLTAAILLRRRRLTAR